jgi:hypothetical protein
MGMTSNFNGQRSTGSDSDMNLEDLDDALHDTFAPKEKKEKKEDEEGEDGENKDDTPAVPDAPVIENEMTLTE